jgi:hypothetical protein
MERWKKRNEGELENKKETGDEIAKKINKRIRENKKNIKVLSQTFFQLDQAQPEKYVPS